MLGINGAAAHLVHVGDTAALLTYAEMTAEEAEAYRPAVVQASERNAVAKVESAPSKAASHRRAVASPPLQPRSPLQEPKILAWCGPIPH